MASLAMDVYSRGYVFGPDGTTPITSMLITATHNGGTGSGLLLEGVGDLLVGDLAWA